ncbi:MFS transporter [Paraburkholderia sp. HD33-4]|uniref:MFS transporter n=1 Tax=Paraburkholderia sp. HD33-4 TaxID=2883242 RepID=UPI001F3A06FC|nr:MFS transporter [Paraburkholderia sp. HD33-4]
MARDFPSIELSVAHPDSIGEQSPNMRKVAIASFVGSLVEFYDFHIYGFAGALVFAKVFFPALGAAAGTMAALATLGVAFVARPLGSILFGHLGDRLGRKRTLVATLLTMGISTALVGLMPSASQIGIVAPTLLIVLRIMQGLAAGGEWAGAALYVVENAPKAQRGFWAMFVSAGGGVALTLAAATMLVAGATMTDQQFLSYGWRIPFLSSFLLVGVGLYIRMNMEESTVFKSESTRRGVSKSPLLETIACQPRTVLLAGGAMIIPASFAFLGASFLTGYGASELHLARTQVLTMITISGAMLTLGVCLSGWYSDRIGRRSTIVIGGMMAIPWALILFPVLNTRSVLAFALSTCVTMFISGWSLGPMSAFLSEMFPTRYRYTAAGLSYNLAQIIGAAGTPIVAAWVTSRFGGTAFGVFLAIQSLLSLLCVLGLAETKTNEL